MREVLLGVWRDWRALVCAVLGLTTDEMAAILLGTTSSGSLGQQLVHAR